MRSDPRVKWGPERPPVGAIRVVGPGEGPRERGPVGLLAGRSAQLTGAGERPDDLERTSRVPAHLGRALGAARREPRHRQDDGEEGESGAHGAQG